MRKFIIEIEYAALKVYADGFAALPEPLKPETKRAYRAVKRAMKRLAEDYAELNGEPQTEAEGDPPPPPLPPPPPPNGDW
jgi:hypothetical protein